MPLDTINTSLVLANPHSKFHPKNHVLLICSTPLLPYNSLSGAKTNGPNALASRYTDSAMDASVEDIPRSAAIGPKAGAMMVEDVIRTNAVADMTEVESHFLRRDQLSGFEAS